MWRGTSKSVGCECSCLVPSSRLGVDLRGASVGHVTNSARERVLDNHWHALPANMIQKALDGWDIGKLDFLFVENVGNLVCPSSYDLGEDLRLVLLSVTEGEDKQLKYPTIFNSADVAVITKMDLAAVVEFNEQTLDRNIRAVRPGMQILKLSAKTGEGMHKLLDYLHKLRQPRSQAASAVK